jgi:hypothetical protein
MVHCSQYSIPSFQTGISFLFWSHFFNNISYQQNKTNGYRACTNRGVTEPVLKVRFEITFQVLLWVRNGTKVYPW